MINNLKKQLTIYLTIATISILVIAIAPTSIFAVPSYHGPMTATQADGAEFTIFGFGDEFFSWVTTEDGHIIAVDQETLNWHYAEISPDGRLVAGLEAVGSSSLARGFSSDRLTSADIGDLIVNAVRTRQEIMPFEAAGLGFQPFAGQDTPLVPNIRPTNNRQPLLVMLIEFNDRRFTESYAEDFLNLNQYWAEKIFGTEASFNAPTVNDYFREVSGSFDLQFIRPSFPNLHNFPTNEDGSVNPGIPGVHSVLVRHRVA